MRSLLCPGPARAGHHAATEALARRRRALACVVWVALLGASACSDDEGSSSTGTVADGGSDGGLADDASPDAATLTDGAGGAEVVGSDGQGSGGDTASADAAPADGGAADVGLSDGGAAADVGPVGLPSGPTTVTWIDLGTHSHAKDVKSLGPFTVTIPEGTGSVAINMVGTHGVTYGLSSLTSPKGTVLVADGWFKQNVNLGGQMCLSCKLRVSSQISASAALLPNAPGLAVEPGTYTFHVFMRTAMPSGPFQPPTYSYPAGAVNVSVVTKAGVGPTGAVPGQGTLDVNLYFTGAKGITAAKAPADTQVQAWLATLKTLYKQANLSVGAVTYHDIDSQYQVVDFGNGTAAGDFEEISALTAKSPWGVNLVFVGKIPSPFGAVLGVAGGLPGPVGVQGTGRSTVLIAIDVQLPGGRQAGADVGLTMAHELGHYLGLFHSSENSWGGFQPAIHDPIDDTPPNDETNLMYWDGSKAGEKLTPQQAAVLRNNPWVRHPAGGTP